MGIAWENSCNHLTFSVSFPMTNMKWNSYKHVRYEVFKAVTTKNAVFWDVAPSRSCANRRFGGKYCIHLQGRKNPRERNHREQMAAVCCLQQPDRAGSSLADFSTLKMDVTHSSKTSVHTRSTRRHIPEDGILPTNSWWSSICELFDRYLWNAEYVK
jgi:hypothetical protein